MSNILPGKASAHSWKHAGGTGKISPVPQEPGKDAKSGRQPGAEGRANGPRWTHWHRHRGMEEPQVPGGKGGRMQRGSGRHRLGEAAQGREPEPGSALPETAAFGMEMSWLSMRSCRWEQDGSQSRSLALLAGQRCSASAWGTVCPSTASLRPESLLQRALDALAKRRRNAQGYGSPFPKPECQAWYPELPTAIGLGATANLEWGN